MSNNINYLLFKRSAIQFKEDLQEISKELDSLNEEEAAGASAHIEYLRRETGLIGDILKEKVLNENQK